MKWEVKFKNRKVEKQASNLPEHVLLILQVLIDNLKSYGPVPGKFWKNYGKLQGQKKDLRHCHLTKGNPTYVCCWEVLKSKRIIEVYYVGTHENASY